MSTTEKTKPKILQLENVGGMSRQYGRDDFETGLNELEARIMGIKRKNNEPHFVAFAVVSVDAKTWVTMHRFRYPQQPQNLSRCWRERAFGQPRFAWLA